MDKSYYDMTYEELAEATRWIDEGIKKGDPKAMREQAVICERFQNHTGASIWRERAAEAEQGYWKPDEDLSENQYERLSKQAGQGDTQAMLSLGFLLQDTALREEAIYWYEKAVANGSERARFRLDVLRSKSDG